MARKMKVSFESEDNAKLFRQSLEELISNKGIGCIPKYLNRSLNGGVGGNEKFIYTIWEIPDNLNIEELVKRFKGKIEIF